MERLSQLFQKIDVKTEKVVPEQTNDVKLDLGKVTLIDYSSNHYDDLFGDYHFSVAKPAELQGFKLGELTLKSYHYDASNSTYIAWVSLNHTVKDEKYDSEVYFEAHDESDSIAFKPTKVNMNVTRENSPGEYGPSPFLGGVINDKVPFFETPNGTYYAFIRLIFTNVAQSGENGQEHINNDTVDESSNQQDTPENPTELLGSENNPTGNKVDKQNEKEFVENIKKAGDTSEKYADNKKLPQTSQSNTALSGLMLLLIGSATAVFAKFKFSTK